MAERQEPKPAPEPKPDVKSVTSNDVGEQTKTKADKAKEK